MKNNSVFKKSNIFSSRSISTIGRFLLAKSDDELLMTQDYQRGEVWTDQDKQHLLESIFYGYNIGSLSIISRQHRAPYIEIIDGKQRLTAILSFISNEYPYVDPESGASIFYNELSGSEKSTLRNSTPISVEEMVVKDEDSEPTKEQILEHFWRKNFAGQLIDDAHKNKVKEMIKAEKLK